MDEFSRPADDAYGRVTAPERYSVLHPAAEALIEDLVRRYDVIEGPGHDQDQGLGSRGHVERIVRLDPRHEEAAPLVIAFTSFPGLLVRLGLSHVEAFPNCGCDACDERPDELIQELQDRVDALVDGRFQEGIRGWLKPRRFAEFVGGENGWRRAASGPLDRASRRLLRDRGRRDWQPWPVRTYPNP